MIVVTQFEAVGKRKYRVTFQDRVTCLLYQKETAYFSLQEGALLTEDRYRELMNEVVGKRAKKRALHLLEQMDRTEWQLRDKLRANGYPPECIEGAIEYVKKFHYLDDMRYASNFVRFSQQKMSRQKLMQKLMQKGIERPLAEQVLEEEYKIDEKMQIEMLLCKRGYRPEVSDEKEFQRTYQYILRRGFQSSDILKAMKREIEY